MFSPIFRDNLFAYFDYIWTMDSLMTCKPSILKKYLAYSVVLYFHGLVRMNVGKTLIKKKKHYIYYVNSGFMANICTLPSTAT